MPKSELRIAGGEYAPVAARVALFHAKYPDGRVITELVSNTEREVVFKAQVFRNAGEGSPAATGWASERFGDGDVNTVACLENTETSAIGRALANLGFLASTQRPSLEEMEKAQRVRNRIAGESSSAPSGERGVELTRSRVAERARAYSSDLQARADHMTDVVRLLDTAVRLGARKERVNSIRRRILQGGGDRVELERLERRLRVWIVRRRRVPAP